MKFTSLISTPALSLVSAMALSVQLGAQRQPSYTVTDLGPAGNPFSQATWLNDYGLMTGVETASDGTQHAVAWYWGTLTDISKPGLGGPNSIAGGVNKFGQIIGAAETSAKDANTENFCGFGTSRQCVAFLWDFGMMTPLPTLGGTNSTFGSINNRGAVAGIAENGHHDTSCPAKAAVNGTGRFFRVSQRRHTRSYGNLTAPFAVCRASAVRRQIRSAGGWKQRVRDQQPRSRRRSVDLGPTTRSGTLYCGRTASFPTSASFTETWWAPLWPLITEVRWLAHR